VLALVGCRQEPTTYDAATAIRDILNEQVSAWNGGDVERFMQAYWRSDQLTFSSSGTVTRGWQETLDNYRRRYPTREQMGTLSFDELEITPLGDVAALVLGRWRLERDDGPVGGNFTLVWQNIDDGWYIIHDHTSRLPDSLEQTSNNEAE